MLRPLAAAAALTLLAAAAPAPHAPKPGRWGITVHPNAIPIPSAIDRDAGEAFRRVMKMPYTDMACLKRKTAQDVRPLFTFKGDPDKAQKSCTATRIDLAQGKVTGEASCTESGQDFTGTVAGTYSADRIDYTVTRATVGLDRPGTVALAVEGVRGGSCG